MDTLLQDLRFALRSLRKNPGLFMVVVVTVGLAVGVNTAIFSVVNGVLLRPLPYPDSEELVTVWQDYTERNGVEREWLGHAELEDLRTRVRSLEAAAGWGGWTPTLTGTGEAVRIRGAVVSEGMFEDVLGVPPARGRSFTAAEDAPDGPDVVVVSHAFWQDVLGGSPDVLGSTLMLSEVPYVVVGVMPEGFQAPFASEARLWAPFRHDPEACGRGCLNVRVVARLADGTTVEQARSETDALAAELADTYPVKEGVGMDVFRLRDDMVAEARPALLVLLGAVGLILVLACLNVANLLLARATTREGEVAVRLALGAGRPRIVRQLLTESAVLAAVAGAAGLLLAFWGTDLLLSAAPEGLPRLEEVGVDGRVLLFTGLATVAAALLFGAVPAARTARADLKQAMGASGRGGTAARAHTRLRSGLVVGQVGLALVLLVGAGLLIESFRELRQVDTGYDASGTLVLQTGLPVARYQEGAERVAFYQALLDRLAALPGVEGVGAVSTLPLSGADGDSDFRVEGEPVPPAEVSQAAWVRPAAGDYFPTMGIDLVEGRIFGPSDDADAPDVVVVNRSFVERYLSSGRAVGRRIAFGRTSEPTWREIVGVVEDVKQFGMRESDRPAVYLPHPQVPFGTMGVVLRTEGDPAALAPAVRRTLAELDPGLAASDMRPMREVVGEALAADRFVTLLVTLFSALAGVLAAVGIYGVISYDVSRRSRELGVRSALGASGGELRGLILRRAGTLALGGLAVGVVAALGLTRFLESLLFGVGATEPAVFLLTAALLASVALGAAYIPATRAARVQPARVLREE